MLASMRRVKALFWLVLVLVVIGGGALIGMRVGRGKFSAASDVKPNLVEVTNAGGIHLYAARVGQHAILFDTGVDAAGGPIDAALGALRAGRTDVTDVFLTHGHFDHVAGAGQLPKAKIHLGSGDVALAEGKAAPDALMAVVLSKAMSAPPITVSDPITGAATFDVGEGKSVKAFPVPGHTAGSYAFLYDGVLFVGDIMVFKQGQLEPTPRIFNPHPEENKAAIRGLKAQLTNETVETVCTGHGGCTPKGLGRNLLDDLISRV
jgi:hydroxyacylglutathione hydrolase